MKSMLTAISLILVHIPAHAALRVSIDPGHGGSETGAVYGKAVESDITLRVSRQLHRLLKNDKQFESQLLRNSQTDLPLDQRIALSEHFHPDLYLSIHANANPNSTAKGAEFYIQNQLPVDRESLYLAHYEHKIDHEEHKPKGDVESIVEDLKKSQRILESYQISGYLRQRWGKEKSRMIRQGPFYVLSQNKVPAVLIEIGYLSHHKERAQLLKDSYQLQVAKKIHSALKDYAKSMDKLPTSVLKQRHAKNR